MMRTPQNRHQPSFLFFSALALSMIALCCQSVHKSIESNSEIVSEERKPLFIHEGSKSMATRCKEDDGSTDARVLDRYFARLQGGKAIIKDQCVHDVDAENVLREVLSAETCSMEQCGIHDTYRRGPLWPALYLATINTAFREKKVTIHSQSNAMNADDGQWSVSSSYDGKEVKQKLKVGLFTKTEQRETYRQKAEFDLGPHTRCIAILKVYRDRHDYDRTDHLSYDYSSLKLTIPPSSGELWAEHKKTVKGSYEVLIIERRLAQERGEGEVLERELLCQNHQEPINPLQGYFRFSYQDINRDVTRVFAHKDLNLFKQ